MGRTVRVKSRRQVNTFAVLRKVSWHANKMAQESEQERDLNCMTAQLFSAFCLEAYLNHLGMRLFPFWGIMERKLSPREKLHMISQAIGFGCDFGERPFQTFGSIFDLRNALVHGKTEHLSEEQEQQLAENEDPRLPETEWQKMITPENAQRFVDDTKDMIYVMQRTAGFPEEELLSPGHGSLWASPVNSG